jgi:hypothetical protein
MQIFCDFFAKIVLYTIFLEVCGAMNACTKGNYDTLKIQGQKEAR